MTTDRELTVPAANPSVEDQLAQMKRWLEGYVDPEGKRRPGLIEMVGDLYEELKMRRERREALARALTVGGVVTSLGVILNWMKDHLR